MGPYQIVYRTKPTEIELNSLDILLSIKRPGGVKSEKSPIRFNIQPQTTFDYRLGGKEVLPINEFDRIASLLRPHLLNARITKIEDLQETESVKDLSFLSGETQIPFKTIQAFVDANKLATIFRIEHGAPIYFALLMNDTPPVNHQHNLVGRIFSNVIKEKYNKGLENNLISEVSKINLDDFIYEYCMEFCRNFPHPGNPREI